MEAAYQKTCYDDHPAYRLHHTVEYRTAHTNPAHLHHDFSLVLTFFLRGTGNIRVEGNYYDIREGDIILVNPGELHCCTVDDDVYHERIALYINECILEPFGCREQTFFNAFYKREPGCGNVLPAETVRAYHMDAQLSRILSHTAAGTEKDLVLAVCGILELLSVLDTAMIPQNETSMPTAVQNPLIHGVLAYLSTHYAEELNVEDIAAQFYTSKYHLCRLFRECVGTTLWEYLTYRRLMAFHELVRGGAALEEACYQVGFRNYSNFFRLYKKYMHQTPSAFRQRVLSEKQRTGSALKNHTETGESS